jgi:hypothetical protein
VRESRIEKDLEEGLSPSQISNFLNNSALWAMAEKAHETKCCNNDDFTSFLFAQVTEYFKSK